MLWTDAASERSNAALAAIGSPVVVAARWKQKRRDIGGAAHVFTHYNLSNHLDDTHGTLSRCQHCSCFRSIACELSPHADTHTCIFPDHMVNDRTWFRAMVTRTCSRSERAPT
eukprot:4147964-Prymnesium_polylepis.1